jgi:hypothetical protein
MKAKRRKAIAAKRQRIETGTNNGWLNFLIDHCCGRCEDQTASVSCKLGIETGVIPTKGICKYE